MEDMKELINKLNQYSYEYYTLGQPSVSDATYDGLYDKLVKLEKETGVILSNSPTQKVGNIVLDKLQKSKHKYPMLSLSKTKSIQELIDFINNKISIIMHKLDGLTIALTYDKNGNLIKGETRGDGEVGEDITYNVKQFSNIPLKINYWGTNDIVVIGEAIIDYNTFDDINSKLSIDNKYKNPRNLVSGSVRQLNSKVCKDRSVKFIAYILEGLEIESKNEQLILLDNFGFDVTEYLRIDRNIATYDFNAIIESFRDIAENNNLPIDGLVVQYDNIEYGKSLGNTSHHPLHSIAFKFENDVEFTKLLNVEWNVSRTGRVNPIAIFEPVELYGTTVSRATVHNLTILKELQLGKNDDIGVTKANEIIPMITDNLTKSNTLEIPKICPVCGESLAIKSDTDSEFLYCSNPNCKAKLIQSISHYCGRNAMNIEGLSKKTIKKFIEKGFMKSLIDIYYLDNYKSEIIHLEGFGIKSYNNLIKSIEKSRECKLENFIYALGIPQVGKSTSKNMVTYTSKYNQALTPWTNIEICNYNRWIKMKDCGEILAKSIVNYFNNEALNDQYYTLVDELTFIEDTAQEIKEGSLSGKTLYCTGTFASGKKKELKELVDNNGGIFSEKFNKSCDYLVIGSLKGSSKGDKAIKMGIEVLTEEQFLNMI